MKPNEKEYSRYIGLGALFLIAILGIVSLIPPQDFFGVKLRRANIVADIYSFDSDTAVPVVPSLDHATPSQPAITLDENTDGSTTTTQVDFAQLGITPFEDYATGGESALEAFFAKLAEGKQVRVAFLGDSFVEGDILTSDLRYLMQQQWGGGGVGYAPVYSPTAGFRKNIKSTASGWQTYNLVEQNKCPEPWRGMFSVAGLISRPDNGATVRWDNPSRPNAIGARRARLLYVAQDTVWVEAVINNRDTSHHQLLSHGRVSSLEFNSDSLLHSLSVRVTDGAASFGGYGVVFDRRGGVCLDNYAVRSNSGEATLASSAQINADIDRIVGYDLVVLQYGLNSIEEGVYNYSGVTARIGRLVRFCHRSFPQAAIVVMGISDRSTRSGDGFATMKCLPHFIAAQRAGAERNGVGFWDTYDAMRRAGGMPTFVEKGWAGKDFTHITYAGGRQIATEMVKALKYHAAHHRAATAAHHLSTTSHNAPNTQTPTAE